MSLGTYGVGSYSHVVVEALNRHYGLAMEAVHYRGEALMWQDVASGAVQGGSGSVAAAASVLQSGNGRPIAVLTKAPGEAARRADLSRAGRHRTGLPGPGLDRPGRSRRHEPEIVQKLSDMMVEGGKTERIQKILDTFGIDEAARESSFFEKVVGEEGPIWIDLVKSLNIEPQ